MTSELRATLERTLTEALAMRYESLRVQALVDVAKEIHAAGDRVWTAQVLDQAAGLRGQPNRGHLELAESYFLLLRDHDSAIRVYKTLLRRTDSSILCCLTAESVKMTLSDDEVMIRRALKRAEKLGDYDGEGADCSGDFEDFEEEDSWFARLALSILRTLGNIPWTRAILTKGLAQDIYDIRLIDCVHVINRIDNVNHQREIYKRGFHNRVSFDSGIELADKAWWILGKLARDPKFAALSKRLHKHLIDRLEESNDTAAIDRLSELKKQTPLSGVPS